MIECLLFRDVLVVLTECTHTTVIKEMCADCGADLRQEEEVFLHEILR